MPTCAVAQAMQVETVWKVTVSAVSCLVPVMLP